MPSSSEASTSRSASPVSNAHDGPASDAEKLDKPASTATFESLGVIPPLLEALTQMKFSKPTDIQAQAIPYALQGRDIIGVAETVSNSTGHNPCYLGHKS
jgi:ATP-dependent RNA helicase DDX47/RRP3